MSNELICPNCLWVETAPTDIGDSCICGGKFIPNGYWWWQDKLRYIPEIVLCWQREDRKWRMNRFQHYDRPIEFAIDEGDFIEFISPHLRPVIVKEDSRGERP